MPHALGRMLSAATRKLGPAVTQQKTVPAALATRPYAGAIRRIAPTVLAVISTGRCAGKCGDCCNMDGKCGTETDFYGWGKCQSGNRTIPDGVFPTSTRGLFSGNTNDGTRGGKDNYVCNELYGLCCNKDGKCGSNFSDCGAGCQPQLGKCNSALPTTTTAPTTTTSLGNGIATPTPYRPSMVSDCDEFHLVNNGDTCTSIASNRGISLANFYA
ncbi:hypothetical protein ANO14919_145880 [Xylariales sp. No.14919]|nr:hypothetical protein ANO14919_145880 [Xylariales sp. No.14919]